MSQLPSHHCMRHFEEPYVAHCRTCNRPFCGRCLVFAFGPDQPPYCIGCALSASGVRNKGLKPTPVATGPSKEDRRDERYRKREERRAAKADAKAAKAAAKAAPVAADAARTSHVPAPDHMTMPSSRYAPPADQPVA